MTIACSISACGETKPFTSGYSGPLAPVADSLFADRPRLTCRGGDRDECFSDYADTIRYLYATPRGSLRLVARHISGDSGFIASQFRTESLALSSRIGPATNCAAVDAISDHYDLRWQRPGYFTVVWANVPREDASGMAELTLAHVYGLLNCDQLAGVPRLQ